MHESDEAHDGRPTFSVITVVRNDTPGLLRTRHSLESQTCEDWEHVVIDGASNDGTAEVVLGLDRSKSVVRSEPDGGIYDAMDGGLALASGRVVVFMNAGDSFAGAGTLALVKAHHDQRSWLWAYGQQRYTRDGEPFAVSDHAPFDMRGLTRGRKWLPHQAVYMELEFARELGRFAAKIGTAADQEMMVRAARRVPPELIFGYLADFEVGGAHDQEGPLARERMWHRIRAENRVLVGNSRALDAAYSGARWVEAAVRLRLGALRRRVDGTRHARSKR